MRDNSKALVEIVKAFESDGHYFAVVGMEEDGVARNFRFGISRSGYLALKKMFQTRPFDAMPGVKYRYFSARTWGNGGATGKPIMKIQIETPRNSKQQLFEVPIELLKNLKWFDELKDWSKAAHLSEDIPLDTMKPVSCNSQPLKWIVIVAVVIITIIVIGFCCWQ